MEDILNQINQDVKDIFQYNIETTKAYVVPTRHDPVLTFPTGGDKSGKLIETCVLMIDIRNSTKISRQLRNDKVKLGKIYSSFIYSMTSIADEYGYVRNIVGDRIMVVFEPKDCFINAVNCAALMYTVATRILSKHFQIEEFKVGIGIEYGEMLVLKAGIRKKHDEQSEYKSLVWVGDAANTASKLCDFANSNYMAPKFEIKYENVRYDFMNGFNRIEEIATVTLNKDDFAKAIKVGNDSWTYEGKKVTSFNLENRVISTSPILISGKVFNELKKAEPKSTHLAKFSSKDYPERPIANSGIYGGHLIVPDIAKIKI
jgi:adenylate cyclase